MISKRIDREKKTSDFERLGRYVLEAKSEADVILWTRTAEYVADLKLDSTGEKVLWYRISNCASQVPAMAIAEVLLTQSRNTRSRVDKTYHCVVSFPEGEQPTREQLEDIEDEMCRALGFGEHQRISAVHQDTDNIHLHLAINKVHPTTFKVLEPYRDYYIRDKACRMLEKKHGLTVDNGIGQGKRYGKEQEMNAHSEQQTLWQWIQDNAKEALIEAAQTTESWQGLHESLLKYGLVIKPRGAGLVVGTLDGSVHIKASSIDRSLSFKRLTERLGEYQPPEAVKTQEQPEKTKYNPEIKMPDEAARALYAEFQAEKQAAWEQRKAFKEQKQADRATFTESLKVWHQGERQRIQTSRLPSDLKREAYTRLSAERRRLQDCQRQQEIERKQALFEVDRIHTWEQFLVKAAERGNGKALELLRRRKQKQARMAKALLTADDLEAARHIVYAHLKPTVRKNGELMYRVQDGGCVTDARTEVRVDEITAGATFLALMLASERFAGQPLNVRGTEAFKRQVVLFAAQYKMEVTFKDAGLEAERRRLCGAMDNPVKPKIQPKSVTPALENPAKQARPELLSPALEALIIQRNRLLGKVSDILPHRAWTKADTGNLIYRGRRNLTDGAQAVLLELNRQMLIKPVQSDEFRGLKVGQSVSLDEQGRIQSRMPGRER